MKAKKWALVVGMLGVLIFIPVVGYHFLPERVGPFFQVYRDNCASCHGDNLEGTGQGPALVGAPLRYGNTVDDIERIIADGAAGAAMPAWSKILDEGQILSLAIFIAEERADLNFEDFNLAAEIRLPRGVIHTQQHDFRIESFADDLDPLPFSIAPLPDGRFLLSEKTRGLSLVSADGTRSEPITGTPGGTGYSVSIGPVTLDVGLLLEAALHPDHEANGWVYLHYGDKIDTANSLLPVSMNRLDRGRIKDGRWTDAETIWRAERDTYTSMPEIGAGGRIAFDDKGHVFISIGMKGADPDVGIQDLTMPYGKIFRLNDDGSIPDDNPFVDGSRGELPSIWTFGHRSPQGLEFDPSTGQVWSSEMGPRGGDEVNLLLPGANYGWPLYSKGVNYDGTPVNGGARLGIEVPIDEI